MSTSFSFDGRGRVAISLGTDGVADLRLTRPDKLNALDPEMFAALAEAAQALSVRSGLRAVVLSGEGRAFCAGLDTTGFGAAQPEGAPSLTERTHGEANLFQAVATLWREVPVPVIAALHGVCFGGGLQLASGADIRIGAPDTRLSVMELKWGLVPDMGGTVHWRGLVRDDVLRELTYTAREFSGEEAQRLGFVTMLDAAPLERARTLAATIADRSPHAVRAAKRLLNAMPDTDRAGLLMRESEEQAALMRSPNQIEAAMAGMARRPARFEDV